ncbi:D-alanyl-D-alanine carboxypeptidase/D-alanyl-D-alanine-endopeptidase [Pedobacter sp.]|uniref:D-alanyl-D-alanine carboxypeptidase/D-alanyl-D-alanine endopeptidase n=1 Tax=Pedobacter sp. TaxID=1411316 RepID=UPI00396C9996
MKFLKLSFLFIAICQMSFAQSVAQKLETAFKNFENDEQNKYATASLCVLDANTGKIIYAKNENTGLATASTLKTITSATAFYLLGKDFKYETLLSYTGVIDNKGTLKGNIIIKGSGDPTLGSWRYEQTKENNILNQWVNAIRNAGIKKIDGSVIADDSAFGTQTMPEGWTWQDMGNYYGAGGGSICWRENQFDVNLNPGKNVGDDVSISSISPAMPYLMLVNELKTGSKGSGDNAYGFLPPYTNVAYMRGTWGLDISKKGISLALPDGAFDAAYRLQDTLNRLGINVVEQAATSRLLSLAKKTLDTANKHQLHSYLSPSLSEIVYWFNKKSINLYGEQLLKTIAYQQNKPGTTRSGANTLINFWGSKGIDKKALNIIDGSGLSPGDRVTTFAMASILFQVQKESWFGDYYNSLPEYNGMKIKSGNISDVTAYAGYHTDKKGNKYVVVINVNNYYGSGISRKLFTVLDVLK